MALLEKTVTSSSATIEWALADPYPPSRPETFIVSYGVASERLDLSAPEVTANPSSQTYSTQLDSLEPATVYFYGIESKNKFASLFTDIESFITNDGRECSEFSVYTVPWVTP